MIHHSPIAVLAESDDPAIQRVAVELAAELNAPLASGNDLASMPAEQLLLAMSTAGLELRDMTMRPGKGLIVDFTSLNPRQAARRGGFSRTQPLARAVGKNSQTVLDATAGLGHDAVLLACMGYNVIAVERSPIIAALLRDGLRRAMEDDELRKAIGDRLEFLNTEAREVLASGRFIPDAVYIDPMFPPKRKASALAKKSIRLVREVVGSDEDAAELLAAARQSSRRAVVKRPTYAPPLAENPTMSFGGKLVRYDVYVQPASD